MEKSLVGNDLEGAMGHIKSNASGVTDLGYSGNVAIRNGSQSFDAMGCEKSRHVGECKGSKDEPKVLMQRGSECLTRRVGIG